MLYIKVFIAPFLEIRVIPFIVSITGFFNRPVEMYTIFVNYSRLDLYNYTIYNYTIIIIYFYLFTHIGKKVSSRFRLQTTTVWGTRPHSQLQNSGS